MSDDSRSRGECVCCVHATDDGCDRGCLHGCGGCGRLHRGRLGRRHHRGRRRHVTHGRREARGRTEEQQRTRRGGRGETKAGGSHWERGRAARERPGNSVRGVRAVVVLACPLSVAVVRSPSRGPMSARGAADAHTVRGRCWVSSTSGSSTTLAEGDGTVQTHACSSRATCSGQQCKGTVVQRARGERTAAWKGMRGRQAERVVPSSLVAVSSIGGRRYKHRQRERGCKPQDRASGVSADGRACAALLATREV